MSCSPNYMLRPSSDVSAVWGQAVSLDIVLKISQPFLRSTDAVSLYQVDRTRVTHAVLAGTISA